MVNYYFDLRGANIARQEEWTSSGEYDASYRGNELAGEAGEALEAAFDLIKLSIAAGRCSNTIKKLERERHGWPGSRASVEALADELADVWISADLVALKYGIDMNEAVARKFNKTSEKVGLNTRLAF